MADPDIWLILVVNVGKYPIHGLGAEFSKKKNMVSLRDPPIFLNLSCMFFFFGKKHPLLVGNLSEIQNVNMFFPQSPIEN